MTAADEADAAPVAASVELVRSEEQLRVGVRRVPLTRVHVRKVIVTEQRTITVDVRREEIHITREDIAEDESGGGLPSSSVPLVLIRHEERVEVTKVVVPVERVTVEVGTRTEDVIVEADLAREVVDRVDG